MDTPVHECKKFFTYKTSAEFFGMRPGKPLLQYQPPSSGQNFEARGSGLCVRACVRGFD